jgi:hypothetical protein
MFSEIALFAFSGKVYAKSAHMAHSQSTEDAKLPQQETMDRTSTYADKKLGFQLHIPDGWSVIPEPGRRATQMNSALTLVEQNAPVPYSEITIAVMHSGNLSADVANLPQPNSKIGNYPAYGVERVWPDGQFYCATRFMRAQDDFVVGEWCASHEQTAAQQDFLNQFLATYSPAPSGFVPQYEEAPAPQDCQQLQRLHGYNTDHISWGYQLASPAASEWRTYMRGIFLCSNTSSADKYLFQCTELATRYMYEQFALPRLSLGSGRYLDYYQDGKYQPGAIRELPASSYQISDDANQGKSAFRPRAGDLLIFQDINDPSAGWKSGLTASPGHVAIITRVTDYTVFIAQENATDTGYFDGLPMSKNENGYHITDTSGIANRIVRGWIHFTANGGSAS